VEFSMRQDRRSLSPAQHIPFDEYVDRCSAA
jgi:hypothetical protein